jgi:hypothetical protein
MRWGIIMTGLAATALGAGPARADDIYTWTDKSGQVHFSNVPSTDQRGAKLGTTDSVPPDEMNQADAAPELDEEQQRFADQAAVQRSKMARELRTMDKQVQDIDARLAELSRARTAHAGGTAITGGLGTNAAGFRSPEEIALETEREELMKRRGEAREGVTRLRTEVSEKLGATPTWWIEPK